MSANFDNPNKLIVYLNGLLDDLQFKPDSYQRFESAIDIAAKILGFSSDRPDEKYSEGPDNLWAISANKYLVIECKNEATNPIINKGYCNQLNGSLVWFQTNYDHFCEATPIMIHPSTTIDSSASLNKNTRIIDKECLDKLKENINNFVTSIAYNKEIGNIDKIREKLSTFKLRADDLLDIYTKPFK